MTEYRVPDSLVTLGAERLLVQSPLLSKTAARVDARVVLGPVLGYLRERIANGPHDYECSIAPPPWVSDEVMETWDGTCDCTVLSILTLLDTGRFSDEVEAWMAGPKA